jgi:transglutaminase-like putative cysteine protease
MNAPARHVIPVILALAVAMAPHMPDLPLWVIVWCMLMWLYMLVRLETGWPVPGPILRHVMAFAGIAGLLATFRVQIGADAFVGLMAVMAGIKPFEMATHRHRMITVLLTYFIIITSLFRSESLWIMLYMFVSVFVTTVALVRINHPQGRLGSCISLTGRIMALAVPLMVALFLLFPRLQQGLFVMEAPGTGRSGFSEILSPGSISRMTRDPSVAFRADFDGSLPRTGGLYWRGIVFERFNGTQWLPADPPVFIHPATPESTGLMTATMVLEPHGSRWLFALDRPVDPPPGSRLTSAHTLLRFRPVTRKLVYQTVSNPDPPGTDQSGTDLPGKGPGRDQILLPAPVSLPSDRNPGTRTLALSLAQGLANPREKLQRILAFFREQDFTYTLTPPRAGTHPVDDFVLKTRQGYCEHYAGALAFMMNALEVPARVVGGYLGGELNPYGNYITVRQSFAHAWVEVFLLDAGWVRVDPTLVVAPRRLEQNPDGTASYTAADPGTIPFLKKLSFMLDAANLKWEAWFTGYSFATQKAWLRRLGLDTTRGPWRIPLVLAGLTLLVAALFFRFYPRLFSRTTKDPVAEAYTLFCKRLTNVGLEKLPDQGPVDFLDKIKRLRPDLAFEAQGIIDLYVQIRFGRTRPDDRTRKLTTRVKQFKPSRQAKPEPASTQETH